jgi:glycosyltransferase involved in cell wall biosynthesis
MAERADDDTRARPLALGVNLAGYFGATLGLGEAARHVADALGAAGVPVARIELRHGSAPAHDGGARGASLAAPHPVTVVCANPDGMAGALADVPGAFADRRVVGLWWWEVMAFPPRWLRAFDAVDEVWVGSRFVADALAAVSPVPVIAMPMPVAPARPAAADRAALGLPEGFLFGFVFDYGSVVARKNPRGLIEAFARAFPSEAGGGERLVLKTLGGERHPEAHAALVDAAAHDPRIHVLDRHLAKPENDALIAALDCYVSLHRSEGFGLTLAEAMLLGIPVVATAYGGPMDFLTPFNAALVDHRLVAIGPGHDPYPPDGEWAEPDLDHAAELMRAVRADPQAARRRAERARADVEARHAPAAAGRAMVERLAHALSVPRGAGARIDALDLSAAEQRVRAGVAGAPPGTGRARGALRDAVLRVLRPYSVHQRLVDEELLRLVRTLDERVRGLATAQSTLAAEVARLRRDVDGDGDGDGR